MSLDAPAPFALRSGFAKDRKEIPSRITYHCPTFFQLPEDRLQAHDRRRLLIAAGTRAGFQEIHGRLFLFRCHFAQWKSLARRLSGTVLKRNEMPIRSLLVVKRIDRLRPLFRR